MLKFSFIVLATLLVAKASAASLSSEDPIDYEYFRSEVYPDYGIRFIRPTLCDSNVTQYAGYVDLGKSHLHFWFFESRQNPEESPLTIWQPGGPGTSSEVGVWVNNGPCYTRDGSTIETRKDSWIQFSNMLYIDQPVYAGFSYGGNLPINLNDTTPMFYQALQLFYEAFPKYSKLPLHMFGESFGGRLVTVAAKYFLEQNQKLEELRKSNESAATLEVSIPLKSIAMGNPSINPKVQGRITINSICSPKLNITFSPEACQKVDKLREICFPIYEQCDNIEYPNFLCGAYDLYCTDSLFKIFASSGRHSQNIDISADTLYPTEEFQMILNRPQIQRAIGAATTNFKILDREMLALTMRLAGESIVNASPLINYVLDNNVRVLVYAGDRDFLCNVEGQLKALSLLKFDGSDEFHQLIMEPWLYKGEKFGEVKGTDKLTFVQVDGAGHQAMYDKPRATLRMFNNWINEKSFQDK